MPTITDDTLDYEAIFAALAKRSFATLATTSPQHRPHAAAVLYAAVDDALYVSTQRSSRKARNIAANPHVFVTVPVRRVPFGAPPSTIQFAATAELLAGDDPNVASLARAGRLSAITSHGELDLPDGCIVRILPGSTFHTYGLGMSLRALAKNPLDAAGRVLRPG
jgi:Pyridoxamine 5'-phosphate oxidase